TGRITSPTCLTTPKVPAIGALGGLDDLLRSADLTLSRIAPLVHGTTLVTNAIIERATEPPALLTTRGFRDALEMGIEQRYDIYDLFLKFPEPLVPRNLRREIDERMSRDGQVLTPIDLDQVRREVADLTARGVAALAVCFLHSYKNPAHERAVKDLVRREFPQLAVSLSSEVVPELREYERGTTTTANAYVQLLIDRYVARLEEALTERGFRGRFYLMQSSGGMASPRSISSACSRWGRAAPVPIPAPLAMAWAARSRPSPTPTCCSATSIPTSSWVDGCGSTRPRPQRRCRTWPNRSGCPRSRRRGA